MRTWLIAIRLTVAGNGTVTAATLHRLLGLGSFHTAQTMAERLRDGYAASHVEIGTADRPTDPRPRLFTNRAEYGLDERSDEDWETWIDDQPYDEDCSLEDDDVTGIRGLGNLKSLTCLLFEFEVQDLDQRPSLFRLRHLGRASRRRASTVDQEVTTPASCDLRSAAAMLGVEIEQMIALSRFSELERCFAYANDELFARRSKLESESELLRQICRSGVLNNGLCRRVDNPLSTSVWLNIRRAFRALKAARDEDLAIYSFLYRVWSVMQHRYSADTSAVRHRRLSRRGLQMALLEGSSLSPDRCNRYAHAILLASESTTFDGSEQSFAAVLKDLGGIDRAVRAGGRKRRASRTAKRRETTFI